MAQKKQNTSFSLNIFKPYNIFMQGTDKILTWHIAYLLSNWWYVFAYAKYSKWTSLVFYTEERNIIIF